MFSTNPTIPQSRSYSPFSIPQTPRFTSPSFPGLPLSAHHPSTLSILFSQTHMYTPHLQHEKLTHLDVISNVVPKICARTNSAMFTFTK